MKKFLIILLVITSFISCSNTDKNKKIEKSQEYPKWVFTPKMNRYKMAGVGISKPSMAGTNRQREIAVTRAIDEIARQLGTKVSSVLKMESNKRSTNIDQYSFQTVDGERVIATLQEVWYNKRTDEIYVWMVVE